MPKLSDPIKINNITLPNRVVMAPMGTNYGRGGGFVSERNIAYYSERARGCVGLIITEAMYVHPSGAHRVYAMGLTSDEFIEGLSKLTKSVHNAGGHIAAQLAHTGRLVAHKPEGFVSLAPSPVPHRITGSIAKEMEIKDIKDVITSYGDAAQRAVAAGFDAVEVHGAHGYLIMQFFSPLWNKRVDKYGGSLNNRVRFPLEIVQEIRRRVGVDFPIIFRMSADEQIPGGFSFDDAQKCAKMLEEHGVDVLHISAGNNETPEDLSNVIATMYTSTGHLVHYAQQIKSVVGIPVITVGRINTVEIAENIIRDEKADMVAVGRGLIADPYWVKKAFSSDRNEIKKCIACNAGCIDRLNKQLEISCVQNPAVGFEADPVIITKNKKKVLVVGAGVAGLEFAIATAGRGHKVEIWEKESVAGGQVLIAAKIPEKAGFNEIINCRLKQVKDLNIKIRYNKKADEDSILASDFTSIVFATGAKPYIPTEKWCNENIVLDAWSAINDNKGQVKKVLIVGGGNVGLEAAHYHAVQGCKVTVIEVGKNVGSSMVPSVKSKLIELLYKHDVEIFLETTVKDIQGKRVFCVEPGGELIIENMDRVIIAVGSLCEGEIAQKLKFNNYYKIYQIGDCKKPRNIIDAVMEAYKLGKEF